MYKIPILFFAEYPAVPRGLLIKQFIACTLFLLIFVNRFNFCKVEKSKNTYLYVFSKYKTFELALNSQMKASQNTSQSNLQTYSKKPQKLVTIRNKEDYVLVD